MDAQTTVSLLTSKANGAKFASFTYTAKGSGKVAKVVMILGASTETLYKKDLKALERIGRLLRAIGSTGLAVEAVEKVVASRKKSLAEGIGNRADYTNRDTYEAIAPGLRVHRETGEVYVTGLLHSETVITPGEYKTVNSRPLTIAKNRVEKLLPSSRYRMLSVGTVSRVAANGATLELA